MGFSHLKETGFVPIVLIRRFKMRTILNEAVSYSEKLLKMEFENKSSCGKISDSEVEIMRSMLRIKYLFAALAEWQHHLLFTLHCERKLLLILINFRKANQGRKVCNHVERTIVQTENAFMLIAQLVRKKVEQEKMTPVQVEILNRYFFEIPFDEPARFIDGEIVPETTE